MSTAGGWSSARRHPAPVPTTMLTTPAGTPASIRISPSSSVEPEVSSRGLTTAVQPAASAKGSFWLTIRNGKFHGVMIETTPIGSRSTTPSMASPSVVVAFAVQVAGKRGGIAPDVDGAGDLAAAWVIGLPASSASRRASSSGAPSIRSAALSRMRERSAAVMRRPRPVSKASRAAAIAALDIGLAGRPVAADDDAVAGRDALEGARLRARRSHLPSISIVELGAAANVVERAAGSSLNRHHHSPLKLGCALFAEGRHAFLRGRRSWRPGSSRAPRRAAPPRRRRCDHQLGDLDRAPARARRCVRA